VSVIYGPSVTRLCNIHILTIVDLGGGVRTIAAAGAACMLCALPRPAVVCCVLSIESQGLFRLCLCAVQPAVGPLPLPGLQGTYSKLGTHFIAISEESSAIKRSRPEALIEHPSDINQSCIKIDNPLGHACAQPPRAPYLATP
jgi:hypothetical protein